MCKKKENDVACEYNEHGIVSLWQYHVCVHFSIAAHMVLSLLALHGVLNLYKAALHRVKTKSIKKHQSLSIGFILSLHVQQDIRDTQFKNLTQLYT